MLSYKGQKFPLSKTYFSIPIWLLKYFLLNPKNIL